MSPKKRPLLVTENVLATPLLFGGFSGRLVPTAAEKTRPLKGTRTTPRIPEPLVYESFLVMRLRRVPLPAVASRLRSICRTAAIMSPDVDAPPTITTWGEVGEPGGGRITGAPLMAPTISCRIHFTRVMPTLAVAE